MFWKRKSVEGESSNPKAKKLPGPRDIPEAVARYVIVELKQDPDRVWGLKSVVRPSSDIKDRFDVRVFDGIQAAKKKVNVVDYTTFDEHSELILYEGWYDKNSMRAHLEEKTVEATPMEGKKPAETAPASK